LKIGQGSELVFDEIEYFIKPNDCEDALDCWSDTAEDQSVSTIPQLLAQFEQSRERGAAHNVNA
jgi:hypothetical protein